MSRDWNSPEAIAFFEKEWDHAIKGAKETLIRACEQGGVLEQMRHLPDWLSGALRAHLGDASYELLIDLIYGAPMEWEFLNKGER